MDKAKGLSLDRGSCTENRGICEKYALEHPNFKWNCHNCPLLMKEKEEEYEKWEKRGERERKLLKEYVENSFII